MLVASGDRAPLEHSLALLNYNSHNNCQLQLHEKAGYFYKYPCSDWLIDLCALAGLIPSIILRLWGFSCVRDAGRRPPWRCTPGKFGWQYAAWSLHIFNPSGQKTDQHQSDHRNDHQRESFLFLINGLGLWIPGRWIRIPATGFRIFVGGNGFWILIVKGDSGFLKLYSGFQSSGFWIPTFPAYESFSRVIDGSFTSFNESFPWLQYSISINMLYNQDLKND